MKLHRQWELQQDDQFPSGNAGLIVLNSRRLGPQTEGWFNNRRVVKTGFCQRDFGVRPMSSSTTSTSMANQWVYMERWIAFKPHFKNTVYPPAIIKCRLCLSASESICALCVQWEFYQNSHFTSDSARQIFQSSHIQKNSSMRTTPRKSWLRYCMTDSEGRWQISSPVLLLAFMIILPASDIEGLFSNTIKTNNKKIMTLL